MINLWQNYGKITKKMVINCNVRFGIHGLRLRVHKDNKMAGE
jgi:hypothetical protein